MKPPYFVSAFYRVVFRDYLASLILLFLLGVVTLQAQAQVASVGAIERVVEKRTGAANWSSTQKGAKLQQGDGLRTGKRSKADALFSDGSLVRLAQLSSLDIQSGNGQATRVRLPDGRVLFVKKPGSGGTGRVRTGTGAAEIKASVVYVQANKDGSAEYINYSGSVSIVGFNAQGAETRRVVLPPGRSVKTFVGGNLSPIVSAAPFGSQTDLINEPVNSPFPSSNEQILARIEPGIASVDKAIPATNVETRVNTSVNPFLPQPPLNTGQPPFGGPFPPPPTGPFSPPTGRTFPLTASNGLITRQSVANQSQPSVLSSLTRPLTRVDRLAYGTSSFSAPIYIAQVPPPAITAGNAAGDAAGDVAVAQTDDFRPTYKHLNDVNRNLGRVSGIDYHATGFVGNNSLLAGIGQFYGYVKEGAWSADLALNPIDIRFDSPTRRIKRNTIVVSQALLSYQAKSGSIIAGRQRFLAGPIRASYFGSMTRVGGREVMDAVRIAPRLNKNYGAEFSYLYDAFPRELITGARGNQEGFLGRVYTLQKFGNFGLNFLKYKDSPVADRTGVTLDFSVPVLTKTLEFYGEVGTDPFKRQLRTFGFTSPMLFQKTGFDLYVERADLNTSASAAGIGKEWAVRLYKPVTKSVDFVGAYNHFTGGNSTFLIGVSVGGEAVFPGR